MSIHWGGSPESIYWNGPVSEVYYGSDLVWSSETEAEPQFEVHRAYGPAASLTAPVPDWATTMWLGGIAAGGGGSYGAGNRDGRGGGAGTRSSVVLAVPAGATSVQVSLGAAGAGGADYFSGGPASKPGAPTVFTVHSPGSSTTALTLPGGVGRAYNSSGSVVGGSAATLQVPDGTSVPGGAGGAMRQVGGSYGGGGGGGRRTGSMNGAAGGPAAAVVCFGNAAWAAQNL